MVQAQSVFHLEGIKIDCLAYLILILQIAFRWIKSTTVIKICIDQIHGRILVSERATNWIGILVAKKMRQTLDKNVRAEIFDQKYFDLQKSDKWGKTLARNIANHIS